MTQSNKLICKMKRGPQGTRLLIFEAGTLTYQAGKTPRNLDGDDTNNP